AAGNEKWRKKTPVPPDFFGLLWPNGAPEKWPAFIPVPPKEKPAKVNVEELGLPPQLLDFLRTGGKLKYKARGTEVGKVRLKPLDYLQIEWLSVITQETPVHNEDPHQLEGGHYQLRVVDLAGEAERHDPQGILAWFCDYQAFGTWDCDHL